MSTVNLHQPIANPFAQNLSRNQRDSDVAVGSTVNSRMGIAPAAWWTMFVASSLALATSSYLAWSSLTSSPIAGCGSGGTFDCSHVLHSRWSTVLSVPVSVPAIATYAVILGMLLWKPASVSMQKHRWSVIGLASLVAGAAAVWFIGLQLFVLEHLCPYCLATHTGGIVLAATFMIARPSRSVSTGWISGVAAASVAMLIGIQSFNETPETFEVIDHAKIKSTNGAAPAAAPLIESGEGELFEAPSQHENGHAGLAASSQFLAAIFNPATLLTGQVGVAAEENPTAKVLGGVKLDTTVWPLLGKPQAELVFVEMYDYTCPHCQRTHQSLEAARAHFGDRLAVILLPVPLDGKCNPTVKSTHASHAEACELAKLAIAVWVVDRTKFESFHHYLFTQKPRFSQAVAKAQSLVDNDALDKTLRGELPSQYIARHVSLYQKAGSGTIPKMLFPSTTTVGAIESSDAMIRLINQNLQN